MSQPLFEWFEAEITMKIGLFNLLMEDQPMPFLPIKWDICSIHSRFAMLAPLLHWTTKLDRNFATERIVLNSCPIEVSMYMQWNTTAIAETFINLFVRRNKSQKRKSYLWIQSSSNNESCHCSSQYWNVTQIMVMYQIRNKQLRIFLIIFLVYCAKK